MEARTIFVLILLYLRFQSLVFEQQQLDIVFKTSRDHLLVKDLSRLLIGFSGIVSRKRKRTPTAIRASLHDALCRVSILGTPRKARVENCLSFFAMPTLWEPREHMSRLSQDPRKRSKRVLPSTTALPKFAGGSSRKVRGRSAQAAPKMLTGVPRYFV